MNSSFELYQNLDAGQMERDNRLQTAILAKEMGLDPVEFAKPFPGANIDAKTITVHNHAVPPVSQETARPVAKKGISTLAAVGIGLLGAAVPGAGILGYLLNNAPAIVQTVEKQTVTPGDGNTKYQLKLLP